MEDSKNNTKKVLVIDDDAGIIKMIQTRLSAHGYEVMSAVDASVGLEMAVKNSPDVIILDVMMPIINGYNICRLLKSEEKLETPIIMVTARDKDEDKEIGKEVGADAYITKPFNTEDLIQKIEELT